MHKFGVHIEEKLRIPVICLGSLYVKNDHPLDFWYILNGDMKPIHIIHPCQESHLMMHQQNFLQYPENKTRSKDILDEWALIGSLYNSLKVLIMWYSAALEIPQEIRDKLHNDSIPLSTAVRLVFPFEDWIQENPEYDQIPMLNQMFEQQAARFHRNLMRLAQFYAQQGILHQKSRKCGIFFDLGFGISNWLSDNKK